ncbi:p-loop containing nucleoside triphosphate hydrolase [Venustampulla echinocandica]|uniref:p-loop containing nucleoside triphosphate hydrolase n=1 Tax=Venustampulla echinocandica TaxID=2656787 RepID=A0A370TXS8_9HELO|nr:p-loop containing nucleoside triphosphate hydrolase [Venustampulla echinocandica]RDL40310.1 p-loop containing nucleoside triphosphate hydrolase [Venustampulla echinocandica]
MQAAALHAIRTAHRPVSRRACRIVGGVRCRHPHLRILPHPHRQFHQSTASYQAPEDPATSSGRGRDIPHTKSAAVDSGRDNAEQEVGPDPSITPIDAEGSEVESSALSPKGRNGKAGSGRIRGNRGRQPEGLPPVILPDWFWKSNVKCSEDQVSPGSLAVYSTPEVNTETEGGEDTLKSEPADVPSEVAEAELPVSQNARYSMNSAVYREIISSLRAGLSLRAPKGSENQSITRPITVLHCPKDGGSYYLDSVVETAAVQLQADLICLDAQDIAQIVGPYIDENVAWTHSSTAALGYETQKIAGKLEDYDHDPNEEHDDFDGMEEEEDTTAMSKSKGPTEVHKRIAAVLGLGRGDARPFMTSIPLDRLPGFPVGLLGGRGDSHPPAPLTNDSDQWNGLKLTTIINTLIDAADTKRAMQINSSGSKETADPARTSKGTIIQIRDYKAMSGTSQGAELLSRLRTAINKRWKEGKNIICVGTTSTEEESALSKPEIRRLQSDVLEGEKRTIYVPPERKEEQDTAFESDEKARIRNINVRHIEEMIEKLSEGSQHLAPIVDIEKNLDSVAVYSSGLEEDVWTYARVHRLAMTVLGHEDASSVIDGPVLSNALQLLASSDEVKFNWGAMELKEEDAEAETFMNDFSEMPGTKKNETTQEKLKQIRKNCNSYEKKLLSGVIVPSDIRTTFTDIRAPETTVEALKTLTSLSLIRPEAFSYGVLATDKIPGLLLYGPPGTGKTLLAKAVAKESGATVLEVSGANLNDMYVGEGEKNVKAVFSLAKKLSPCVVFIDEADAIFSARGQAPRSGTHRELINQFLREWDGMDDLSAFIMVATNRPFDLDEAVLRRLPRRLLVDLPTRLDREAILKIHLKEEVLDESVSLSKLGQDTPFYSGSDLKNLSVAAALACIREENETAAKHTGSEPYVYPAKRILTKTHFDKALEEISASISEDMSTLAAIRKFDEKYGDRKGRRKKASALGFGGTTVVELDSEAARVRKMDA